ncbi:MAG TPA: hypothetical protein VM143_10345 [Acidimicrobiales bacterium]|nr:hypothetical protein [Acidimicrobiales bacterium]
MNLIERHVTVGDPVGQHLERGLRPDGTDSRVVAREPPEVEHSPGAVQHVPSIVGGPKAFDREYSPFRTSGRAEFGPERTRQTGMRHKRGTSRAGDRGREPQPSISEPAAHNLDSGGREVTGALELEATQVMKLVVDAGAGCDGPRRLRLT